MRGFSDGRAVCVSPREYSPRYCERGESLISVSCSTTEGSAAHRLCPTDEKGAVVSHYFGRGQHLVTVHSGECLLRGILRMRSVDSKRRWWLDFTQSGNLTLPELKVT